MRKPGVQASGRNRPDLPHDCSDGGGFAVGNQDLPEHARARRLHVHARLLRLHLEEHVSGADGVPRPLAPSQDCAFGHGFAELRHEDLNARYAHASSPRLKGSSRNAGHELAALALQRPPSMRDPQLLCGSQA
jgi:hypothetical protein